MKYARKTASIGGATSDSSLAIADLNKPLILGLYIVAILFNLCLIAQVFTVGMAYFYDPEWWQIHGWLVRGYGGLSLILAIWVCFGNFSQRIRSLAISMPIVLGLQVLTIHLKTPIPVAVVHPLIGFTLFSASTTLVHRISEFIFPKTELKELTN